MNAYHLSTLITTHTRKPNYSSSFPLFTISTSIATHNKALYALNRTSISIFLFNALMPSFTYNIPLVFTTFVEMLLAKSFTLFLILFSLFVCFFLPSFFSHFTVNLQHHNLARLLLLPVADCIISNMENLHIYTQRPPGRLHAQAEL